MKKATHFKGIPAQWPPVWPNKTNFLKHEFSFGDAAKYEIGAVEQPDWNKLTGLKLSYFHPTEDALILAWRWLDGKFQVAPYLNKGGQYFYDLKPVLTLVENRAYMVEVSAIGRSIVLRVWDGAENLMTFSETWPDKLADGVWEVGAWFGGSERPPKKISFSKEKKG